MSELNPLSFKIMADDTDARKKLGDVGQATEDIKSKGESNFGKFAKAAGGVGLAVGGMAVAAVSGLTSIIMNTSEAAGTIQDASARMKISAEDFQELRYAAEQSGVSMGDMEAAAKKLAASGSNMTFDEAITQLAGITDESERAAKAQELFGKSAYSLTPLLNEGAAGIAALRKEARDTGQVMSNDAVAGAESFGDSVAKLQGSFSGIINQIGTALMPSAQKIIDMLQSYLPQLQPIIEKIIQAGVGLIEQLLPPVMQLVDSLLPVVVEILSAVFAAIQPLLPLIVNLITSLLPPLMQILTPILSLLQPIIGIIVQLANMLLPPLVQILNQVISAIMPPLMQVLNVVFGLIKQFMPVLSELLSAIFNVIMMLIPPVMQIVNSLFPLFSTVISKVITAIMPMIPLITEIINKLLPPLIELFAMLVDSILPPLMDVFMAVADIITSVVMIAFDAMKPVIDAVVTALSGVIQFITSIFKGDWDGAWNGIKQTFTGIWDAIKGVLSGAWDIIKGVFNKVWDTIKTPLQKVWDWISGTFQSVKDAFTKPFDEAVKFISGLIDKVKGFFTGLKIEWPKIKSPHFSISWDTSGVFAEIGKLLGLKGMPKLKIDWYDKGGVFYQPSIIGVGEKRPEFVGALDDLRKIVREETGNGLVININYPTVRNDNDIQRIIDGVTKVTRQQQLAKGYV